MEDAFQKQLDAHPDDHLTRLVFADWLEEQGDERAIGYRAMGELRLMPYFWREIIPQRLRARYRLEPLPDWHWMCWEMYCKKRDRLCADLDTDWYALLPGTPHRAFTSFPTRRDADDAAARAFARLPPERRAELLHQEALT